VSYTLENMATEPPAVGLMGTRQGESVRAAVPGGGIETKYGDRPHEDAREVRLGETTRAETAELQRNAAEVNVD
jgi:hypothetical protein